MDKCVWVVLTLLFSMGILPAHTQDSLFDSQRNKLSEEILLFMTELDESDNPEAKIVEMLVMQSWAHCFHPSRQEIQRIIDLMDHGTTALDLENEYKSYVLKYKEHVPSAMFMYLDKWENEIKFFKENIDPTVFLIGALLDEQGGGNPGTDGSQLDVHEVHDLIQHGEHTSDWFVEELKLFQVLKEMAVQSYVRDFGVEPDSNNKFQITNGTETRILDYPPLDTLTHLSRL